MKDTKKTTEEQEAQESEGQEAQVVERKERLLNRKIGGSNITYAGLIAIVLCLAVTVGCVFYLNAWSVASEKEAEAEYTRKLLQVRKFINTWYVSLDEFAAEQDSNNNVEIYKNELRFVINGEMYTMTFGANRLRATYPNAEKAFYHDLGIVNYIEFYLEGSPKCRMSYGEGREYTFKLG